MMNAILLTDGYKLDHRRQYPKGTEYVYSNWTPRSNAYFPEAIDVAVRCRITNAEELFILMQVADILKRQCMEICVLEICYLMGMRCDRLFDVNRPFTLKIVADMINSIGARQVYIYEPHSDRAIRMINNAAAVEYTQYIESMLLDFNGELLLVAPDEGAALRYGIPFAVTCGKVRDVSTGKLISFKATENISVRGRDLLMIDDLCDGGGTFIGLAPKVRELEPKSCYTRHTEGWYRKSRKCV